MRIGVLYQGKYNFHDVYHKLYGSPSVATIEPTEKGLLWAVFKDFRSPVLISPQGKVQVYCDSEQEKKQLHKILQYYLGELQPLKITISSRFTQLISCFPLPQRLKFSACDTTFVYNLKWFSTKKGELISPNGLKTLFVCLSLLFTLLSFVYVTITWPKYIELMLKLTFSGLLLIAIKRKLSRRALC